MSDWAVIKLVAGREISERIHGRLIRVMTIATALLVVVGVTLPGLIKGSSAPTRVGLVGSSAQTLAPTITRTSAAAKVKVALSDIADQAEARTLLTSGKLDVALSAGADSATVEVKSSLSATVRAVLQSALDGAHFRATLAQAGIPAAKVLPALEAVPLTTTVLQPKPADQTARYIAAIAAGLLMYVSLALYGGAVATGVAQEKTSRTAEVLLAAVRPGQLLTGKVLGIGSIGLGQLAIAAAAGLIANAIVHSTKIPSSVVALIPAFLVCFLAGFLLYAFAFAAAGAMVSRQEEVQMVTTPIALPLLIGYLLVYAAVGSPNATWLKVLSFFPPLTATLMPARIALGHVAPWELPLAALIMIASIVGMARLASRIYSRGLIHSGPRLSLRAALQLSKGRA
ncbi:MAG TPA: ABC transporter permease [Solirubrobacteraceae bacterium]|nr:ABC transporter permease [Solirubrobacteraceae bacterium]